MTGALQYVVSAAFMLVAVSLFIRKLGTEQYGLFSLVGVVGSINVFTGLGLNVSLVRFLSVQGRTDESSTDILVNFVILFLVASLIALLGIPWSPQILRWLMGVPVAQLSDASDLFALCLIANVPLLIGQTFTGLLDAVMKVYLTNLLSLMYATLYWGLIAVSVFFDGSLHMVGISVVVAAAVWCLAAFVVGMFVWKPVRPNLGFRALTTSAGKQVRYGIQVATSTSIGILFEPVTKVLLSHLGGSQDIAFIDIGFRVKNQVWGFVSKIQYTFYPAVARMSDHKKIGFLINDLEQKTILFSIPIIAVIVTVALPLTSVWIRLDSQLIAFTIASVTSAHLLFSSTITPYYQYLIAKGFASRTIVLQIVNVGANGLVLLLGYQYFGYPIAVLANTTAIFASCVVALLFQRREFGLSFLYPLRRMLRALFVLLAAIIVGFVMVWRIDQDVVCIAAIVITLPSCTVILFRYAKLLTWEDINLYADPGSRVLKILGHMFAGSPRE
jgi:O-antigen/teichoic acid export membrane protein